MSEVWTPRGTLRWVIRDGEKILQQCWKRSGWTDQWRDVVTDMETRAERLNERSGTGLAPCKVCGHSPIQETSCGEVKFLCTACWRESMSVGTYPKGTPEEAAVVWNNAMGEEEEEEVAFDKHGRACYFLIGVLDGIKATCDDEEMKDSIDRVFVELNGRYLR